MDGSIKSGESPKIKVDLKGPFTEAQSFDAIIDTGFTGSVSMPIVKALPLGLLLFSTASFTLADGSKEDTYLCIGQAILEGKQNMVVVSLSKGSDVLIGTDFLATFKIKLNLDYENNTLSLSLRKEQSSLSKGKDQSNTDLENKPSQGREAPS